MAAMSDQELADPPPRQLGGVGDGAPGRTRDARHPERGAPIEGGAGEVEEREVDELDPETRARRDVALRQIRKLGDPVLRARAVEIDRFDDALRAEIARMGELMHDALGVGLAATQLGRLSRVLVYQAHTEDPLTALVNPVIERASEAQALAEEGCLSIPGIHVEVERPTEIDVRAQDPHGRPITVHAEGLEARVIQHEVDHLDGILMLDRTSRERRRDAMRALREAQRGAAVAGETGGAGEAGREPDARLG